MSVTADSERDARRVFETVRGGGVAVFPVDVGYAIVGNAEPAIRTIYTAKRRSFDKPCGMFGSWELFREIFDVGPREQEAVSRVIHGHRLPLSVVAPFRRDHPVFAGLPGFVLRNATKAGTLDMLMSAGPLHDAIARLSLDNGVAVLGSSANRSLTGSKYRLADVEPEVRAAADLVIDGGPTKYSHPNGMGSTIIDLSTYRAIRVGVCFDAISRILAEELAITVQPPAG